MRTFLDSGILLTAWKREHLHAEALALLADESRQFFSSQMVRLELLPKPRFEKRTAEVGFYESFFAGAVAIEPLSAELGRDADSLHTLTPARWHPLRSTGTVITRAYRTPGARVPCRLSRRHGH